MIEGLVTLRAALGMAVAQLRYYRVRTVLAVVAIALAVLTTTVLASVGIGVMETGTERFQQTGQDLWLTGGPIRLTPGTTGGLENAIVDSHELARAIEARDDVRIAAPIAYQTVYVGTDPRDLQPVVGVGVKNVGSDRLQLAAGTGFQEGDSHYAGGSYDGPMTREVIIDPRLADALGVTVGDRLHLGGTIADAREHEFTIVGISPTFSRFLGTTSATLHLSELQTLTGTAATDRTSLITIQLESGADPVIVQRELERQYPRYEVRTNREQLEAIVRDQALVIATGLTILILAIITGIALSANALAIIIYQQSETLAALKAAGVSSVTLTGMVTTQALLIGIGGGLAGVALTVPAVAAANVAAERLVGFANLVHTTETVLGGGFFLALVIGLVSAIVATRQITRITPLEHLQR